MSILGSTNVDVPDTIQWIFQASSFAFASVNSSVLSTDCLIDANGRVDPAVKRLVLRFAIPWFSLVILMVAVILRSVILSDCNLQYLFTWTLLVEGILSLTPSVLGDQHMSVHGLVFCLVLLLSCPELLPRQ